MITVNGLIGAVTSSLNINQRRKVSFKSKETKPDSVELSNKKTKSKTILEIIGTSAVLIFGTIFAVKIFNSNNVKNSTTKTFEKNTKKLNKEESPITNNTRLYENRKNLANARPEFKKLLEENSITGPLTSGFFRNEMGRKYEDVIAALKMSINSEQPTKMLIVGVGEAQEPFSYLAVLKDLQQDKSLDEIVDLNCVDIQPQMSNQELRQYACLEKAETPKFALKSFEQTNEGLYKVKENFIEYLQRTFNDKSKTHWNTSVNEYTANCPREKYNLISMNHVLMYIEDKSIKEKIINDVAKIMKPGGIFITDTLISEYEGLKNFKEIVAGIFQRL